jgi:hypothetical protein
MMMAVPALMVALSILLPAFVAKWLNVVLGIAYAAILAVTLPGAPLFYWGYGAFEIPVSLLITLVALNWPKSDPERK